MRSVIKNTIFGALFLLFVRKYRRSRRKVIIYHNYPDFSIKAKGLTDLFRRRGFPVELCSGSSFTLRARLTASSDLWIGFWNGLQNEFFPKNYIFLNAEPLNIDTPWIVNPQWFSAMKNAKEVWDYNKMNIDYLTQLGVNHCVVPFGYAPYYEVIFKKHTARREIKQDIDVLFFGSLSERRIKILDALKLDGLKTHIASRMNPAYGRKLDELLARSKIVIHIHQYEEPQTHYPDMARLDYLLSNQIFVLHEKPSPDCSNPEFEKNVSVCLYNDILATCKHFLERPEERARMAVISYEWLKLNYHLDRLIPFDHVEEICQGLGVGGQSRKAQSKMVLR